MPTDRDPTSAANATLAIISNEPTPYRLHVLGRISRELPQIQLQSIFTHTLDEPSTPWAMRVPAEINPVFFSDLALKNQRAICGRSFALYKKIRKHLIEHHAAMVILLGYNDLTRMLLIRWAFEAKLPLLITGDSNIFSEGRVTGIKRVIKSRLLRYVIHHSAGLMPMGTCGRAFFRLYDDHAKPTFLFPYEPDYSQFQKSDPARDAAFLKQFNLDGQRKRLLFCARLVEVKRADVLIDAFAQIAADRPDWDLVMVGDGPLRDALRARVPAEISHRVQWLGFLQTEQTVACYHICDALVLPSEYEPWALVINEAVAAGLAVVATEVVGAAVELVRHEVNGLIVSPRSVGSMREALRELTQGDRCAKMRKNAPTILAQWRAAADPVEGVRQAWNYFCTSQWHAHHEKQT